MSLAGYYYDLEEKLEKRCGFHNLQVDIRRTVYHIVFHFSPQLHVVDQTELDMPGEEPAVNRMTGDAYYDMIFDEGLIIKASENFTAEAHVLNTLGNMAKKMHYLYLQMFFESSMTGKAIPAGKPDGDDDAGGDVWDGDKPVGLFDGDDGDEDGDESGNVVPINANQ